MSTHELKIGDRIRLTQRYRMGDYQPGDRDEIVDGPGRTGTRIYFRVAMDADATGKGKYFLQEEIEPDV